MDCSADKREIELILDYPPLGLLTVNRSNLRLDGLFVDTAPIILPHQSEVAVTLKVGQQDGTEVHKLRARVVGRSRYGTHLTFQDCRRETYDILRLVVEHH